MIILFYQIVDYFVKSGKGFDIGPKGSSLKYCAHHLIQGMRQMESFVVGTSALGSENISLNNGIEQYEWKFCIETLKDDLFSTGIGHCLPTSNIGIGIGIINTEQYNIDITNVYAQKLAVYGNMYGLIDTWDRQSKVKAYSIELDGKTKTWIEAGQTSNDYYKSENGFKPNDTITMIVNFKYRYVVFIKNDRVLCIYKNCKMDTMSTFRMYCTLTGIENDFKVSLIYFQAKKYISDSAPLCNKITAAFDKLRDKILLKKQAKLSQFDHYVDAGPNNKKEIWQDPTKGILFIYLDKISHYARMVFCDESDNVTLLQYMDEVHDVTKGVDFVDFNGYDYVKFRKMEDDKMQYVQEWLKNKVKKPKYINSVIYKHGWNDLSLITSAFKDGLLDDLATKMGIDGADEQAFKDQIEPLLDTEPKSGPIGNSWKLQFVGDNSEQCVKEFVKLSKTCFIKELYNN